MDIIIAVRRDLENKPRAEVRAFAEEADVPFHTLRKIISGETKDARHSTVEKIRGHYEKLRRKRARRLEAAART